MAETEGPRATGDPDLVGQVLDGRYRILSLLGRGGMSTVFLADDERMSRKVCVKVPHPSYLAEPGFRERFAREIESLTRMEHPHVVRVHDAGEWRGLPYAVMQYLGGGSLRGRFAWHGGRVPPEEPLTWLPAVSGALQYLHDHGLVHRDVKPTNVLFDEQGHVFVADFGIAKALGERETGLTQTGQTPGSPEYMAPEVVTGGTLGPAYDQYALGVVVYQALSGRFPFEGKTPLEVLVKKRTDRPAPLARHAPGMPPEVAAVVMRAIDREPSRRFASVTAFAEAYRRAVESSPTGGALPVPGASPAARSARGDGAGRTGRGRLVAASALAVVALGALAWTWISGRGAGGGATGDGGARAVLPSTPPTAGTGPFEVAIEAPASGSWSRTRDVVVRGRVVKGAAPAAVRVGAVAAEGVGTPERVRAPVVDGAFAATLSFAADGRRTVYVEDAAGEPAWTAEVGVDATPPRFERVEPAAEREDVRGDVALMRARVVEENLRDVRVGETLLIPDGDAYESGLSVGPEWRSLEFVARDHAGNEARVERRFRRKPAAAPAGPWRDALEKAVEAARARRLSEVRGLLDAATKAGTPASEVPVEVVQAVEGWDAVNLASQRLFVADRDGASEALAEARRKGVLVGEVPEAMRPLFIATDDGVRVDWFEPFEGAVVLDDDVLVRGRVAGGPAADAVTVNGVPAALEGGRFAARVPAPKALGAFEVVVAAKRAGKAAGESRRRLERGEAPEPVRAALRGWGCPAGAERDEAGRPLRVRRLRDGAEMRLVPAGAFHMGAVPADAGAPAAERPRWRVTLSRPYWLDATEVTNDGFAAFVLDTGRRTTAEAAGRAMALRADGSALEEVAGATWRAPYDGKTVVAFGNRPVVQVSWEDAAAYAEWAGVALPTEAQFERAARAGVEDQVFPWGAGAEPPRGSGNFRGAEFAVAHPRTPFLPIAGYEDRIVASAAVASFGANAYGLSDLVGNVWEWCADWYSKDGYPAGDATDPTGPSTGTQRVLRGGSWFDATPALRLSARAAGAPTSCFVHRGFRCARAAP